MYIQGIKEKGIPKMNTYQIISKRNGKVLATVEAVSRLEAVQSQPKPNNVSAVLV